MKQSGVRPCHLQIINLKNRIKNFLVIIMLIDSLFLIDPVTFLHNLMNVSSQLFGLRLYRVQ